MRRKQNVMTKQQALAVIDDNDLALLGEAAQSLAGSDMVGESLKFKQGVWRKKTGSTGNVLTDYVVVKPLEQFVVDVRSYKHGWIRWRDKKPTHKYVGRKVDHWPLPTRDRLPEQELKGTPEDPWQETHMIVMRCLGAEGEPNANGALYTWARHRGAAGRR
jgi:hypothetical protein